MYPMPTTNSTDNFEILAVIELTAQLHQEKSLEKILRATK